MRLVRLELKAFGPFTERILEFTTKPPGLHLIFGANEAGKSSSLRALKALLCGFPQQTPDNFLHSYDQLLVAGRLRNAAGEELSFQRRKKRVGDVLDEDGNPLDAAALTPFLHGLDASIFNTLYGIDHETLVRGGEEILAQKGEVGQALFSAGAGLASVGEIIAQLEKEAGELFKATGQLPLINTAVKRFRELQKEMKTAGLSVKEWKEHRKNLENGEALRAALEQERDEKGAELHRLQRLQQAVPELAALMARRRQLQDLGEVVLLDPDFTERYQQVSRDMREAAQKLLNDRQRLATLIERRHLISLNTGLLHEAERVDDFHQRLGEFRKGRRDRPERNGMRISLRTEAGRLLQQIRPDLPLAQVESLRPMLGKKRTIQALIAEYQGLQQQRHQAEKQGRAAQQEYRKAEVALLTSGAPVDTGKLQAALKSARKVGEVDEQLGKNSGDLAMYSRECFAELKRVGLWQGDLLALPELALPLAETVRGFEKSFAELHDLGRELEAIRKNCLKELQQVRAEIKKEEYVGEVPREEELILTREKRQFGWHLLRRQWLDGENIEAESIEYAGRQPLVAVYEGYVGQADSLADRLRREADRVAVAAACRAQVESLEATLADNDRELLVLQLRRQELTAAWHGIWRSVDMVVLSPKEMLGWLAEIDKLRFKAGELGRKQAQLERDFQLRATLREALVRELSAVGESAPEGESLGPAMLAAEAVIEEMAERKKVLERNRERRDKAAGDVHRSEEDLQIACDALTSWQEQWRKALAGFGRQDEVTTLEAVDLLESLQGCFDKLKEADDLQKRIDGIDRDADALNREVMDLLAGVAPELSTLPLEQAIIQLRVLLGQTQKDGALREELNRDLLALEKEIEAAESRYRFAEKQMNELLRLAKCEASEALPAIINRFAEYQRLRDKIVDHEESLAKIGAGVSLSELAAQAAAVNIDELPALIEAMVRDTKERLHPEINRLSQVIGEEKSRLAAMDGGARAAELTEAMERELALIRRLAGRYTLVKLAARVLQQAIDRYREEHQDPVLKIAAEYFRRLTLDSFAGLRADVDDGGRPVLVAVRENGVRLTVDKMSSGSRDQMFLALRLATLRWRLQTDEPMPFIIDDILINFDDARSRATLEILAELGEKNQVILFTHHRRIVEEAGRLDAPGAVQIHELAAGL